MAFLPLRDLCALCVNYLFVILTPLCAIVRWSDLGCGACVLLLLLAPFVPAQRKRRAPAGGQTAVVVDERLSALREEARLNARLVQRLGRGRAVSITGARRASNGVDFYRVAVTRRTRGWLQRESVVSPARAGDDEKLLRLIHGSEDFDRLARARIFLDHFPRSPLRPAVLLLFGDQAEQAATKLTRAAERRLDEREMKAGGAPMESYFLNFNELDRYNKQGISFIFERAAKRFYYDGESWREVVRRFPNSPEAAQARKRLGLLSVISIR
ncbi:MAG: tetratricopeptide repeat protein [Pyrinomonadaceae bacterium]